MKLLNEQDKLNYNNVWVLAEFTPEGDVHGVSFELLGVAREIAADLGCEVWAVAPVSEITPASYAPRAIASFPSNNFFIRPPYF